LEHDVASGEVIVDGTRHSVSATTVTLSASNADPRKDVIYVDSTGTVAVASGTPAPAKPSGETGRDTYQPSPPDLSGTAACPLAEIWVGGGVTDTGSTDISDRRVFADITAGSVDAQSISLNDEAIQRVGPQQRLYVGLREGLVGHWPLDDASTGLEDTVNDNDISITGTATVVSGGGAFGDGVRLGDADYGTINHGGALSVEDGDFTISVFVRAPNLDAGGNSTGIVQKKDQSGVSDSEMSYGLGHSWGANRRGQIACLYGDGSTVNNIAFGTDTPENPVGEGPLHHIAYVYDSTGNRVTLYVNGSARDTGSFATSPIQNTSSVTVGAHINGSGVSNFVNDVILSDLRIYDRQLSLSEIRTLSRLPFRESPTFRVQRREKQFSGAQAGPVYRYDDSKTDPHRLLIKDRTESGNPVELHTSSDLETWTEAASGLFSGYANSDSTEPSDYVYDGSTYYVYATDDTNGTTEVFTGSDWTSLTHDSEAVSDPDCGAFRDDDGITHIYAEDADFPDSSGFGSDKISHWTADTPNGSFTEQDTAVDLTDVPWHTGDPDIEQIDGDYWMFTDNTMNHAHYGTALYRSTDLYTWELIDEQIKDYKAGDLEVASYPDGLIGFCELDGGPQGGISIWDVFGPREW
jgi:hypothetical protein